MKEELVVRWRIEVLFLIVIYFVRDLYLMVFNLGCEIEYGMRWSMRYIFFGLFEEYVYLSWIIFFFFLKVL